MATSVYEKNFKGKEEMNIQYIEWYPRETTKKLVDTANNIIRQYQQQGYTLTLRQLYYKFVSKAIIENTERSYKNLGNVISKARMAGLISWDAIEDRNREHHDFWTEEDILTPIRNLPYYIRFDKWHRQPFYVEVWVEKEALGNVVQKACNPYLVPHMACKGYLSSSEAWRAGQRFIDHMDNGQDCVLIHLGDHDPSGIDMTRDNDDRLSTFTDSMGEYVDVRRIALNMNQVSQYNPPPNPAKVKDSRAKDYIYKYGNLSWELDALEPSVIVDLIQTEIKSCIDEELWASTDQEQKEMKEKLKRIHSRWDQIEPLLN